MTSLTDKVTQIQADPVENTQSQKPETLSVSLRKFECMGFGSYDESEQENPDTDDIDENDGVSVHEHTHEGEVSFESDASQDELLDKLGEIKENEDDDDD